MLIQLISSSHLAWMRKQSFVETRLFIHTQFNCRWLYPSRVQLVVKREKQCGWKRMASEHTDTVHTTVRTYYNTYYSTYILQYILQCIHTTVHTYYSTYILQYRGIHYMTRPTPETKDPVTLCNAAHCRWRMHTSLGISLVPLQTSSVTISVLHSHLRNDFLLNMVTCHTAA